MYTHLNLYRVCNGSSDDEEEEQSNRHVSTRSCDDEEQLCGEDEDQDDATEEEGDIPSNNFRCAASWYFFLALSWVAVTVTCFFAYRIYLVQSSSYGGGSALVIKANDLHAIHDLLMVSYAGIWMRPEDHAGIEKIQKAVCGIASLLPTIHPVEECRQVFSKLMSHSGRPAHTKNCEEVVIKMAEGAWQCLPGRFSAADFSAAFTSAAWTDHDLEKRARNPMLMAQKRDLLGVCRESTWDRTCSYWVSLHSMTLRAEQLGKGKEFLKNAIQAISSGATQCKGCQRHFRMLHEPLLKKWRLWDSTLNDTELRSRY
eukprot:gnl/MRDRNA2_/MRDRNA2_65582_c0_seq1.p1 gnl/MRDRNA2_/MRDRNA2_65582_c0~~gnl/MRDRNA2_/MRDRNA2_65582_c0_seq1.p1  ORF type:complete len:314 (+),score=47.51 gnl/MRDRNA2_/MRDRNA2_65582_c0_seq1:171-1112(+)